MANLYPGPLENTPAGAVVSMVDFDDPDLERFPRFPQAMAEAWVADLEPGDAIYITFALQDNIVFFQQSRLPTTVNNLLSTSTVKNTLLKRSFNY